MPNREKIAQKYIFSIGSLEQELIGFTDGVLWNGWECPYFEYEEALKILKELGDGAYYSEEEDAFYILEGEDWEQYKSEYIVYEGEAKKVYGIGRQAWIWTKE